MKLVPNWKQVLTGAWSVWLMAAVAMIEAAEVLLDLVGKEALDPLTSSAAAGTLSAVGILARVMLQRNLTVPEGDDADPS
ncbi:MAG: hypothetical protein RL268_859 [Pseudomonadota bacterium]|jgi:hypothetical protein